MIQDGAISEAVIEPGIRRLKQAIENAPAS
jgi:hypothetical protein